MIVRLVANDAPYPVSKKFTTNGGKLLVQFSGSAWSGAGGKISVDLLMDGTVVATASVFTNEPASHKALVPVNALISTYSGEHTVSVAPSGSGTNIDHNDYFTVLVIESEPDF
jgi:hypothetical protein